MKKKNQLYEILIKNLKEEEEVEEEEEEEEETLIFWNKVLIQPSDAIYIFFLIKKKAKTEFKSIKNFKSNVKPYRLPENMSKSAKKEQSKLR